MRKSAIIVFLAFLAFLFVSVLTGLITGTGREWGTGTEETGPSASDWSVFESPEYGFSFSYPPFAQRSESPSYLERTPVVQFNIDREQEFSGTNYADERFAVSVFDTLMTDCRIPGEYSVSEGIVTVNGNAFNRYTSAEAAAGNLYQSELYRIWKDGTCIEFALTLHTTNIGNYEPGTVVEADRTKAWEVLKSMFESVRIGG